MEQRGATLGSRQDRPVPVGVKVKAKIQRGEEYFRIPIPCTLEVTVLDVVRGDQCSDRLKADGVVPEAHKDEREYCLVHLRLGYSSSARGTNPPPPYVLETAQLKAASADGQLLYDAPYLEKQPQAHLTGLTLNIGETKEGWVVLEVPQAEKQPLLAFYQCMENGREGANRSALTAPLWFKLYRFDPAQIECSGVECRI